MLSMTTRDALDTDGRRLQLEKREEELADELAAIWQEMRAIRKARFNLEYPNGIRWTYQGPPPKVIDFQETTT
jgi:hypothetical protein